MSVSIAIAALLLGAPLDRLEPRPPGPDLALREPEPAPPLSVYRLNLAVDVPVTVGGGLAGLARLLFKDRLTRISCPCDPSSLNFIDRGAVSGSGSQAMGLTSDVSVALAIGAPVILDLVDVGLSRAFGEDLMVFVETLAVNNMVQQVANFAVSRPRPRTYANDPGDLKSSNGYLSFYSGHVAMAVASLSVASFTVRQRYGEQIWPWFVTGAVGGSIAVERVLAGAHFPTDVAAGALAGLAFGIAVPWLHARAREQRFSVLPAEGGRGLALAGAF